MNRAAATFFNLITLLFIAMTVIMVVVVISIAGDAMDPPLFAPEDNEPLPTQVVISSPTPRPSWTPSHTPTETPTALPTETPTPTVTLTGTATATATATFTATATGTLQPSATFTVTPTNTLVPPTATRTPTPTPTASATPSPTLTPTGPTFTPTSQFPFIVQPDSVVLRENFANTAGCNWQGIAGQVITARNEAVMGVQVRVRGSNFEGERTTLTGTNTFYGPSGWEIVVADEPVMSRYTVELWANGERVSPTVDLVFPGSCQQNLATVNFVMTRPYQ